MTTIPVTECRCCHLPMRSDLQERVNGKPPLTLVTCDNPLCGLFGYTFTTLGYADMDLAPYLKMQRGVAK